MVGYTEAIKRPFSDLKKLLIGVLLAIVPIINFFSYGYILESVKTATKKKMPLPEWTNWGSLFLKGILYMVIGILYAIPGIILLLIGAGGFFLNLFKGGFLSGEGINYGTLPSLANMGSGFGALALIGILWFIVVIYVVPAAVVNFANQGKFGAAFEFSKISKKAFTGKYFTTWLVSIIIYIVIALIASILNIIPVVGPSIGSAITSFIGGIIYLTLIAQVCAEIK